MRVKYKVTLKDGTHLKERLSSQKYVRTVNSAGESLFEGI